MRKKRVKENESGMALLLVLFIIIIVGGAIAIVSLQGRRVSLTTNTTVDRLGAEEAAKAGIDIAIEQFWNQFQVAAAEDETFDWFSYSDYLDGLVANDSDLAMLANNQPISADNPVRLASGTEITGLTVSRDDSTTSTDLTIRATGRSNSGVTRTAVQTVSVGGAPFNGWDFALLSNNITCILCHAEILSVDQALNNDPDKFGTFDKVKIASLEQLMIRTNGRARAWWANTNLAGTAYTRGRIFDHYQTELTNAEVSATAFDSYPFDEDGKILETAGGNLLSPIDMIAAELDPDGLFEANQNLYVDYPSDESAMTDGDLPNAFPPPYPELNNNRYVDDFEFAMVVEDADGSITGGVVVGVPDGSTFSGTDLPTSSSPGDILANGAYEGNVVLVGTEDNPIILSGTIAIDGDLMIAGVVEGTGNIQVRGNTYVVGDVTYNDDVGTFGQTSDGEGSTENLLGLTSGGSIMIGDYVTARAKPYRDHTPRDGFYSDRFTNDLHIDYRDPDATSVDRNGDVQEIGYLHDSVVDDGNGDTNPVTSFTTGQLMLYNRMEFAKAQVDPSYTPRYYQLRGDQPIYQYLGNEQHTDWYDNPFLETITGDDLVDAAIHDLSPTGGWLSEDQLRAIWFADEMSRDGSDSPFRLDGLYYSNNAIFAEVHSKEFHNSNTNGQMIVRGAIVAADLGMLIPGADLAGTREALTMLYDPRVKKLLPIEDTTDVELRRKAFWYES